MKKWIALLVLLAIPAVVWGALKPVRILAPRLNGLTCKSAICTDAPSRYKEASALYQAALSFVDSHIGEIRQPPRVVFCASQACFASFGFKHASANTIGTFGIVIGPSAWREFYLRHEMIHYLQNEKLGSIKMWLEEPRWFTEGMAYALSEDPREHLGPPWQRYREHFKAWYARVGRQQLWVQAAKL